MVVLKKRELYPSLKYETEFKIITYFCVDQVFSSLCNFLWLRRTRWESCQFNIFNEYRTLFNALKRRCHNRSKYANVSLLWLENKVREMNLTFLVEFSSWKNSDQVIQCSVFAYCHFYKICGHHMSWKQEIIVKVLFNLGEEALFRSDLQ